MSTRSLIGSSASLGTRAVRLPGEFERWSPASGRTPPLRAASDVPYGSAAVVGGKL